MDYTDYTVKDFTEKLASASAVPGGGGASALAGAVGMALGNMAGELTVGKKKYADVEEEIRSLMGKARELSIRLLDCIQKDARAFEPLSKAYRIPRDTEGGEEILEGCLRNAAEPPMEIFELCCEAIEVLEGFARRSSRLMASDVATGAAIVRGAMTGAAINVKVNTKLMKDRAYAENLNARIDTRLLLFSRRADQLSIGDREWFPASRNE